MAYLNLQSITYAQARVASNSVSAGVGFMDGGFTAFSHAAAGHYVFTLDNAQVASELIISCNLANGATGAGFFIAPVLTSSTQVDVWVQDHTNANADADFTITVSKVRVAD